MNQNKLYGFATRAIHAGEEPNPTTNAHNTPIYQTVTYRHRTAEALGAVFEELFDPNAEFEPTSNKNLYYTRMANPTTAALERKLAALEGMDAALVVSSGMAAVTLAVMTFAQNGDHILVDKEQFVVSRIFFTEQCPTLGIEVSFVDVRDMATLEAAIKPNTTLLFTESLTNPGCYLADLPKLQSFCHNHALKLIVDNTFCSPYLLRPAEFGVDLVIHSTTKYLSGHGDTISGALIGSTADIYKLRMKQDVFGQCTSPLNAWLTMRGVRTLPLRMRQHSANALKLATLFDAHDRVEWVRYPGLSSHPQHDLATRLLPAGFGGMMAVKVTGGREGLYRFVNAITLFDIAVNLGDLFTLIYPIPEQDNLIRISVGCEDIDDILSDFEQALAA